MKKSIYILVLTSIVSLNCFSLSKDKYASIFKNYHACYILFDVNKQKIIDEYNPNQRCQERLSPDSTFKIALSLMAFNQGIINQHSKFKWNGQKGVIPEHDKDQTPYTWLQYSVLWVSQQITPQLGVERIKRYLAGFHYGNQDFSGDPGMHNGITHAWLSSSLKISAIEQLHFLNAMLTKQLSLKNAPIYQTKENLYLGELDNGAKLYGKTGSGRHGRNERLTNPSLLRDGWFVGFIVDGHHQYIFVSNLTDKKFQATKDPADGSLIPFGSQLLKPITMALLNEKFSLKAK